MDNIKAGVVLVSKFCTTGGAAFKNYINYIDRDEAVRNDNDFRFDLYNEYMGNPDKTSGLFTDNKDRLTNDEKNQLKEIFKLAEKNGSIMWQHVISFDNRWLIQQGLVNEVTGAVNEGKLQEVTRLGMQQLQKAEKLENAVWSAAIHFNTDNIHIHIAMVEPIPMRERKGNEIRGKIKRSSLEKAKSKVVNTIIQQQPENNIINNIIRNNIVESKKYNPLVHDKEFTALFMQVHSSLPSDRRLWNYRSNAIKNIIPMVDKMSEIYINKYHSKDLRELKELLDSQENKYRTAYGLGSRESTGYTNNKMKDLYYRLGNTILKQIKEFDKDEKKRIYQEAKERKIKLRQDEMNLYKNKNLRYHKSQYRLKTAIELSKIFMKDEMRKYKELIAYEIMEQEEQQAAKEEEKEK